MSGPAGGAGDRAERVFEALSDETRRRLRAALAAHHRVPLGTSAAIVSAARALVRDARAARQPVEWAIVQLKRFVDALPCPAGERAPRATVRARLVSAVIRTYYAGSTGRAVGQG